MYNDITLFVNKCHKCQINKAKTRNIEKMIITKTPQASFDKLIIDTVGPLPSSDNQNKYVLTAMCDLSKYLITCALPSKDAKSIAKAIFENIYLVYGPFKQLLSDCGTEFLNSVLSELLTLLNTEQLHSTAYHHQTVGTVERNHRIFNEWRSNPSII